MSQISNTSAGGSIPVTVPTSFITDNGTAIPAAYVLNVNGGSLTTSNDNGVIAQANPNGSANLQVALTNRLANATAVNVTGAVTGNVITFALGGTAAVYRFKFDVTGRETTTGNGVGYTVFGSARTNGTAATMIATPFVDNDEDSALLAADMTLIASGNNVILQATGVAATTIAFKAVGNYVVV